MTVNVVVEGDIDEAVSVRLIESCQLMVGTTYGKRGWSYIQDKIFAFNQAAEYTPYLALVDFMDTKFTCPSEVVQNWLPERNGKMLLRAVVREIESWLLADRMGLAEYLHISPTLIPLDPEAISDPKQTLINLARRSRSSKIKAALLPEPKSTAQIGPFYTSELVSFVRTKWDIDTAEQNSRSLQRCLLRLSELRANF